MQEPIIWHARLQKHNARAGRAAQTSTTHSSTRDVTFTFCNTAAQVESAIAELLQYDYVCLDCEGRCFGKVDGALSLLCLGTPVASPKQDIFVFDVPALTGNEKACASMCSLLANPAITKVTYDGRCDYLEIWDAFGVAILPVLDLQLVEALALDNTQRLWYFTAKYVKKNKDLFEGMRRVIGMEEAMRLYAPHVLLRKEETVKEMHKRNESYRWMDRPLSPEMFLYAAGDVRAIAYLLKVFRSRQIIPTDTQLLAHLKAKSERYVTCNGAHTRTLEIAQGEFAPFAGSRVLFFPAALSGPLSKLLVCRTCSSRLPLVCYQVRAGRRRVECRACVAWAEAPGIGGRARKTAEAPPGHVVHSDWITL
ncbi:hypothetical protein PENSPDRAFT_753815 [Peniophora sp. CONT]|nr:hypothetical protein PENSPDRAFT_753815 [Peniophora sp. CONT]